MSLFFSVKIINLERSRAVWEKKRNRLLSKSLKLGHMKKHPHNVKCKALTTPLDLVSVSHLWWVGYFRFDSLWRNNQPHCLLLMTPPNSFCIMGKHFKHIIVGGNYKKKLLCRTGGCVPGNNRENGVSDVLNLVLEACKQALSLEWQALQRSSFVYIQCLNKMCAPPADVCRHMLLAHLFKTSSGFKCSTLPLRTTRRPWKFVCSIRNSS